MGHKHIAVFYHADCLDGFGAAYAAWKKFGHSAEYIPVKYGAEPSSEEVDGKEAYLVDFCYPKEVMDRILARAKSLVVLDHHQGIQDVVESMPQHVFDAARSGATIAWSYFHPDAPAPRLLQHIQDEDLYTFTMPDTRPVGVYLAAQEYDFELWDRIVAQLEDETGRRAFLAKANTYLEYFNKLVDISVSHAHPVHFEGHTVLLANSAPVRTLKSAIGNALLKKVPPFGLIMSVHPKGLGVSIRGDGTVDVAAIARKYGGNGHPRSAGFRIPWQSSMPFTSAEEHDSEGGSL